MSLRTILFSFIFLPQMSFAATYYVSPAGSDANAGTVSKPWKTLTKVVGFALKPGDVVFFRGGDYVIPKYISTLGKNGTSTQPITFKNYPGERPVIVYNGTPLDQRVAALYISGQYQVWDGINLGFLKVFVGELLLIKNIFRQMVEQMQLLWGIRNIRAWSHS